MIVAHEHQEGNSGLRLASAPALGAAHALGRLAWHGAGQGRGAASSFAGSGAGSQGWGRIVNIASEAVSRPGPGFSAYAAGKGAMVALSRNLALELGPSGVTVNVVAPGWIATPRAEASAPETLERLIAETPLGYQGRPEHVAGAVLFFASPLADFVSRAYMPVSGAHGL